MSTHSLGANDPLNAVGGAPADPQRVLEEIKRLAVEQLGAVPGLLFRAVEQALNVAAAQDDPAQPGNFEDLSALRQLRQQNASLMMRFRQQVAQGFDDFRGLRVRHRGDLPLGLVDHEQLDFHLAGQRVGEQLAQRYSRPLEMMQARLRSLTGALGVAESGNPIGPERLVAAFVETFRETEPTAAIRILLFQQYEQELARVLGDLYGRINSLLASAGYDVTGATHAKQRQDTPFVLDTVEPVPHRRAPAGAPQGLDPAAAVDGSARRQNPVADVPLAGPALDAAAVQPRPSHLHASPGLAAELSELHSLLRAWREGSQQAAQPSRAQQNVAPPRRELRVEEVLSVASMLQPEPPDAFARALAGSGRLGDTIRDHLSDGARRLGLSPDQTQFSAQEEDAIDLVALLFDSLFRSHSLQDRARRLYARLVLPYVKVALTDESVFVAGEHPARKLLDAITEACEGNVAATPHDRELLDRAAAASQRIVAEYNEDMAVFELAHAELDALLNQQRRRGELQEQRAVKATMGRERLGCARSTADGALQQTLGEAPVTDVVAEFLSMSWRHHVVQTVLRDGDDNERRNEVLGLGEALVEVDRLAAANRGCELADRLLELEPAIMQCLAGSGLDESAARQSLATLVHALATPDRPRHKPVPAPLAADNENDGADDRRLWLAGGTDTVGHDQALAARMRKLAPGEWLRLTDTNGEVSAAKVAWVSPLTSRFLLVNRRGVRVLVASAEELALLASAGRVQVGTERTAFDEAMRHVRQRLDKAVGQH
ncbi:MAG: DUF1631 domain-containing protein [Proteobacteria bacterium]|nr:DUF1631 domain-containing protein [Pseudomonadota bacterium]